MAGTGEGPVESFLSTDEAVVMARREVFARRTRIVCGRGVEGPGRIRGENIWGRRNGLVE